MKQDYQTQQYEMNRNDLAFVYPPDLEKCKKHRLANRIFKGLTKTSLNTEELCECCDRIIGSQVVKTRKCFSPISELMFLGPGVPLMFVFMQHSMAILLFLIFYFALYSLISNINGDSCQQNSDKCNFDIFTELSIANKIENQELILTQTYLSMGFVIIFLFIGHAFLFRTRKIQKKCDEQIDTPSDYAIVVSNLPPKTTQQDIQAMIQFERDIHLTPELAASTDHLAVQKIIMSYSLQEFNAQQNQERKRFQRHIKTNQNSSQFQKEELQYPTETSSFAVVVFKTTKAKDHFLEPLKCLTNLQNFFCNFCLDIGNYRVKDTPIVVTRAPEPDDIIWQNSDIPKSGIIRNKSITLLVGMSILMLGGVIQYYLDYSQKKITNPFVVTIISFISSAFISLFNYIIVQFLIFLTKKEGNYTTTMLHRSLLFKICLLQFFNAGIFYSLANILAQTIQDFNIQGDFSFEITIFMVFNAITPCLTNLGVDYLEVPQSIFRFFFLKKWIRCYSQKEGNELYKGPVFQITFKYAYVIKTLWISCFYGPFVPIVIPIALIGIILFYLTELFLFRTTYSVPNMISSALNRLAIKMMYLIPFMMCLGQLLIMEYLRRYLKDQFDFSDEIPVYVSLALSIVLPFLPTYRVNCKLFYLSSSSKEGMEYDKVSNKFEVTYESTNPASKTHERKREINLLRSIISPIEGELELTAYPTEDIRSPSALEELLDSYRRRNSFKLRLEDNP